MNSSRSEVGMAGADFDGVSGQGGYVVIAGGYEYARMKTVINVWPCTPRNDG